MSLYNNPLYRPPFYPMKNKPVYCPCMKGTGAEYIKQCRNMYVYVWTVSKKSFWFYPVKINNNDIYGYICNGIAWDYSKLSLDEIDCIY